MTVNYNKYEYVIQVYSALHTLQQIGITYKIQVYIYVPEPNTVLPHWIKFFLYKPEYEGSELLMIPCTQL